jgi:hypothetical protein
MPSGEVCSSVSGFSELAMVAPRWLSMKKPMASTAQNSTLVT